MAGDRELEPEAETVQRRPPGSELSQAGDRGTGAAQLVVVLAGLHRDVVAEPLGLLVCVGVAADVDQQRRVVDDCPVVLVESYAFGESQRDQALAQHVLHRLPEAEVDPERERRYELREPHMRAIGASRHLVSLYPALRPPG